MVRSIVHPSWRGVSWALIYSRVYQCPAHLSPTQMNSRPTEIERKVTKKLEDKTDIIELETGVGGDFLKSSNLKQVN